VHALPPVKRADPHAQATSRGRAHNLDNLKTAVLQHPSGDKPLFHPRYLDFAAHYGFEPRACNVRQPHEKELVSYCAS
jgi:transposase